MLVMTKKGGNGDLFLGREHWLVSEQQGKVEEETQFASRGWQIRHSFGERLYGIGKQIICNGEY
jgi:hypothetical protein